MPDDAPTDLRREDVDEEFERAEQMLADATTAHEVGISTTTVIDRLYYAMETYRRRVDYGSGSVERDVEELIEETTAFLEAMRRAVEGDEA